MYDSIDVKIRWSMRVIMEVKNRNIKKKCDE
jgi:hypothetical protein